MQDRAGREQTVRTPTGGQGIGGGSATGGQTGRRGAGNRGADRPAGTQQQALGQTGEGSGTGRISVGEAVLELRESSVSIERPHSLSLAETEWGERIDIEEAGEGELGAISLAGR